eukprot:6508426-Prymnesium_polylepis.1
MPVSDTCTSSRGSMPTGWPKRGRRSRSASCGWKASTRRMAACWRIAECCWSGCTSACAITPYEPFIHTQICIWASISDCFVLAPGQTRDPTGTTGAITGLCTPAFVLDLMRTRTHSAAAAGVGPDATEHRAPPPESRAPRSV